MGDRGSEFAHIAYTLLIVEKVITVEDVAKAIGMTYATLHSRLIGRSPFSADEIRALIQVVADPRLVSYLLDGTGFVAAERLQSGGVTAEKAQMAVQRGATKVVVDAAGILELVDASLVGGGLDHRQRRLLLGDITEAERALASLRLQVEDKRN
jgi:hypothetical protein